MDQGAAVLKEELFRADNIELLRIMFRRVNGNDKVESITIKTSNRVNLRHSTLTRIHCSW